MEITLYNIGRALHEFHIDCGRYPSESEGLSVLWITNSDIEGWHGPYFGGNNVDPWRMQFQYSKTNNSFFIFSMGPDKIPFTKDDIGEGQKRPGPALIESDQGQPLTEQ